MLKTNLLYLLLLTGLVLSLVSCDKEEPIPAYLYIPSFEVEAQADFGTSSSKITEAWVYANGNLLGAYPIPAMVPILEEGATDVQIFPGIHENGILDRPFLYSFYEPIKINPDLKRGHIDTIPLITMYKSSEDIELALHIDFEIGNLLSEDIDGDTLTFTTLTNDGFEGRGVRLFVQDTLSNLSVGNTHLFYLPSNGSQVFIEMNYHNDIPFTVWMRGHKSDLSGDIQLISQLNIKKEWNKIYIPLTEFLNANKWIDYQLVFNVSLTNEQIEAGESGEVILDNIKILKFK